MSKQPNREASTFAEDLRDEAELLRRRLVHHGRKRGPLTLGEAIDLCREMDKPSENDPRHPGQKPDK